MHFRLSVLILCCKRVGKKIVFSPTGFIRQVWDPLTETSAGETDAAKVPRPKPGSPDPSPDRAWGCPRSEDPVTDQAAPDNPDWWWRRSLPVVRQRRARTVTLRRTSTGAGWCPWPRCRTCTRSWLGSPEKRFFYLRACANSIKASDKAALKNMCFLLIKRAR